MNRKERNQLIQLAFGEVSSESDGILAGRLHEDPEFLKEAELLESLKRDLSRLREVPECQLSVERVRDAVLREEMSSRANWRKFLLASAPVGACIALFAVWQANSGSQRAKPEIWVNPVAAKSNSNPNIDIKLDHGSDANMVASTRPGQSRGVGKATSGASIVRPSLRRRRNAETLVYHPQSNIPANALAMSSPVYTVPEAPKAVTEDSPKPPVVVIGSNTDANTGANVANEVENASDVVIGG